MFSRRRHLLLGYGVMVTQQILVLLFLVRIQVAQLKKRGSLLAFFILPPRSSPHPNSLFRNAKQTNHASVGYQHYHPHLKF